MEDKDRGDFLFLDLPSLPSSKQSRPTNPLIEALPKLPDQPKPALPINLNLRGPISLNLCLKIQNLPLRM